MDPLSGVATGRRFFIPFLGRGTTVQAPPAGVQPQRNPGVPKGWVALAKKETDTHRSLSERKSSLFLGQLSFYRMNITSLLSHHILHQILVSEFCQYFSSPCFSPMHSSGTFLIKMCFILIYFILMSCTLVSLPQWPNIFTLTKTMFHKFQYSMNPLDNKTIHEKGYKSMFDISENSTIWKPWYFALAKTTKSQSTIINYEATKHLYRWRGNGNEAV